MRATVEHIGTDEDLPALRVRLVRGCEDLSIKVEFQYVLSKINSNILFNQVSDRGGGISRSILSKLFNYMFSTAPPPPRDGSQAPLVCVEWRPKSNKLRAQKSILFWIDN